MLLNVKAAFCFHLYLLECHKQRTVQGVIRLSVSCLLLHLTLFLTSAPLISSLFSLRVCLPCLNIDRLSPSLSVSRSSASVSVSLHPCTPVSSLILALSVKTPNCFIGTAIINCTVAEVGCARFAMQNVKKKIHSTLIASSSLMD